MTDRAGDAGPNLWPSSTAAIPSVARARNADGASGHVSPSAAFQREFLLANSQWYVASARVKGISSEILNGKCRLTYQSVRHLAAV